MDRISRRLAWTVATVLAMAGSEAPMSGQGVLTATAAPAQRPEVAAIRARGKLVMLCYPHQLSTFVRADLKKGYMPARGPADHFIGIDVDIMKGFAEHLGVALEVRRASKPRFAALIPDLLAGKGDLIASSMSVTEERQKKVDFSQPYFAIYPVIVVRSDSPIGSPQDLRGKIAAAIPGSSQEERLLRMGVPRELIHSESFMVGNYGAVIDGIADYTLVDSGSAERVLPEKDSLKMAFRLPGVEHYAIAVRPGSDLLPELNQYIDQIKISGELSEIIDRHLK